MYKTASHYFQRFKEATGRNAFSLYIPIKSWKPKQEAKAEVLQPNTTFSPWMRRFLKLVASAQKEIFIVSPYLKLSMIRPFLLALPNKSISMTVLTKFSESDFRLRSDLQALELLIQRPGVSGQTRILGAEHTYPGLFIIDRKKVLLERLGRVFTKFEVNFRNTDQINDLYLAQAVYSYVTSLGAMRDIKSADIERMKSRLSETPAILGESEVEPDVKDLVVDEIVKLDSTSSLLEEFEVSLTDISLDEIEARDKQIEEYIEESKHRDLNSLGGKSFESPLTSTGLREAAIRDIERIRATVIRSMVLDREAVDSEAVVAPFVHQYWCDLLPDDVISHGLQRQMFVTLGNELVELEVALHFARQIAFDDNSAAAASIATHAVISQFDYETFLESNGINFLLNKGGGVNLPKGHERTRVESIVGLQFYYSGHRVVCRYLRKFLSSDLSTLQIRDDHVDPMTLLQNFTQLNGVTPQYDTIRSGGTDDAPVFTSSVIVGRLQLGSGSGRNKKEAQASAAQVALDYIRQKDENKEKLAGAVKFMRPRPNNKRYFVRSHRLEECKKLGHRLDQAFEQNLFLLDVALTHASFSHVHQEARSYQRLAFVGSYISNILLIEDVIRKYGWRLPGVPKEEWQKRRRLLNPEALPLAFNEMGLRNFVQADVPLVLDKSSVKADVVQAILAGIFLIDGIEGCKRIWARWIRPALEKTVDKPASYDAVTFLQELTQGRFSSRPRYEESRDPESPGHRQRFKAICYVDGKLISEGKGFSKKEAKQEAARIALTKLQSQD